MSNVNESLGRWDCVKTLGSGAFGSVKLWQHKQEGTLVAVKTCKARPQDLNKAELIKLKTRWNNELEIMLKSKHENIVQACPAVCPDLLTAISETIETNLPPIAMEFCEAGSLRDKLQEKQNINGLNEFEVRELLSALTNAVHYLHTQHKITHRDIKPDNIVLKNGADGRTIYKLTDVGYARLIDVNTIMASMVGTTNYFAPEIAKYAEYKNSVDYWSVGVVAYETMCGIHPFLPGEAFIQVIKAIDSKPDDCVAITKIFNENPIHRNTLRPENRLSATFAERILPWLRIALNQNGHTRGYDASGRLIFYDALQAALSTRVVTVFWINKCKLLSYNLTEVHTMQDVYEKILKDTDFGTSLNLFHASGHRSSHITADPNQLYDERLLAEDRPMLYLATFVEDTLLNPDGPIVPGTIPQLLSGVDEPLTTATLQQCLLDDLYMHQSTLRVCLHLFNGLNEFAINLEDNILTLKGMVDEFNTKNYEYHGKAVQFETMVRAGMQSIAQQTSAGCFFAEMEERAKYFKNLFVDFSQISTRCDKALFHIRDLIKGPQASVVADALEKITRQVKQFEELPFDRRPDRNCADQIVDMIRMATVNLITARKEFLDAVKSWLMRGTTVDTLVALLMEYMNIRKDLQNNQKLLDDAHEQMTQVTNEYFKQIVQTENSSDYESVLEKMGALDVSSVKEMSVDELLRCNDMCLKLAAQLFDDPMGTDS